jgi:prevent-host-death family protein
MAISINTKIRLSDFRRTAGDLIAQLKTAKTQQESRVVVTTRGKPAVVVQEYRAYQRLLELIEKMEREIHLVEAKKRILENEAQAKGVSLEQVAAEFGIDVPG